MPTIDIPHDPLAPDGRWRPREYQLPLWEYLEGGGKRAIEIWHRRSGKDDIAMAWACVAAHQRPGSYWHMLPEAAQARKSIWDAIDPARYLPRIDVHFPLALRENTRNSDMFIKFKYASTYQVIGSDNFNSLVGSPPVGLVFSEWALANPSAWGYLLPIVEENNGWVLFITTPRGHNHAERMYQRAINDPDWHASILTPDDTGLFSIAQLDRIRNEYIDLYGSEAMADAMFQQEYWCSFDAAILGAVYAKELQNARKEQRITSVPHQADLPVETWWDLGYRDSTAIWFIQRMPGGALHAIDYYEQQLEGLDHYVKVLQEKPYTYSQHLVPHDAAKGELGTGQSLVRQASELGLTLTVQPQETNLQAGINATRPLIRRMWFDARRCADGIDALSNYRYEWDERKRQLAPKPVHDWSSHGADALRTGAHSRGKKERVRPELPKMNII